MIDSGTVELLTTRGITNGVGASCMGRSSSTCQLGINAGMANLQVDQEPLTGT
jgi:hypothetical protein